VFRNNHREQEVSMWNLVDVDPGTVTQAANRVDDAGSVITLIKQRMEGHRANILDGWRSDASAVFGNVLDEWILDLQGIMNQLNGIHEGLQGTAVTYHQSEQERQQAATQLRHLLNYK
jgi:WXG100 family type VII secretion target